MDKVLELILDEATIAALFSILALVTPILGIGIGYGLGVAKRDLKFFLSWGLILGLSGPVLLVLWKVYNAITAALGLDTVKNLVVNLALFTVLGLALGVLLSKAPHRRSSSVVDSPAVEASVGDSPPTSESQP